MRWAGTYEVCTTALPSKGVRLRWVLGSSPGEAKEELVGRGNLSVERSTVAPLSR